MSPDLKYFLSCLSVAEHVPRPDNEEWKGLIDRISVPGKIADIDAEAYDYFLEVLQPDMNLGGNTSLVQNCNSCLMPAKIQWHCHGYTSMTARSAKVGTSFLCFTVCEGHRLAALSISILLKADRITTRCWTKSGLKPIVKNRRTRGSQAP